MTTFTTQDRQDAQRTPLTKEEIIELAGQCLRGGTAWHNPELDEIEFARAIERAHGIGE